MTGIPAPHNWDAASYDQISGPQMRWGATVVPRLALSGNETVLDAGCGTGRVTEGVLSRLPGGCVVGLDGSPDMAATAAARLGDQGGRLSLVVADLRRDLPFAPSSFDGIISTATFHWIPDHQSLFRELARVLRPGGQLVAQCGGPGNITTVMAAVEQVSPGEGRPTVYEPPGLTADRLAEAGFTGVETWLNPETTPFDSWDALGRFLTTVVLWPNLARRPASDHAPFVSAVMARLPACELDYVRLNMVARRA